MLDLYQKEAAKFYRINGVINRNTLLTPPVVTSNELRLSRNAVAHLIFHYEGNDHPSEAEVSRYLINPYIKHLYTHHRTLYNGRARTQSKRLVELRQSITYASPMIRPIDTFNNRQTCINYGLLEKAYVYPGNTAVKHLFSWGNIVDTLVQEVLSVSRLTSKPQYILIDVPEQLPDFKHYLRTLKKSPLELYQLVGTGAGYLFSQFVEWCVNNDGPLSRLASTKDVYWILRTRGKHVLYLNEVLAEVIVEGVLSAKQDYSVSAASNLTISFRIQMLKGIFKQLAPDQLVDDSDTGVPLGRQPVIAPELPVIDLDSPPPSEPTTKEARIQADVKDLRAEPLTAPEDIRKYEKLLTSNEALLFEGQPLSQRVSQPVSATVSEKVMAGDSTTVAIKGMKASVLPNLDRHYTQNVMESHILKVFDAFKSSGLVLTNVEKRTVKDITGEYQEFKVTYTLANGGTGTEIIRLPVVDEDGTFTVNGIKSRMRRQAVDYPIRKIAPKRVALSSYAGTLFVDGPKLAVDDYVAYISRQLAKQEMEGQNISVIKNDFYDNLLQVPDVYSRMSKVFSLITLVDKQLILSFNYGNRDQYGDIDTLEKSGAVIVGQWGGDTLTVKDSSFYRMVNGKPVPVGTLFQLLELDEKKVPVDVATINILGQRVYLGMVLSYLYGITDLLKHLKVKVLTLPPNKRVETQGEPSIVLTFMDVKLVITQLTAKSTMILQGIVKYAKLIKHLKYEQLNERDMYLSIMQATLKSRHIKEFTLLDKQFVDPITKEVLEAIKEPTTFRGLLFRAVELLSSNDHPKVSDARFTRYRGYERFPGIIYNQLFVHLRQAALQVNHNNRKLKMSPYAVWQKIQEDNSTKIAEDINPMVWMKEQECVTLSGMGGRTSDTLTAEARKFHPTNVGTIAEYVPDDGNVGMVSYLTAAPKIDNIYGIPEVLEDITENFIKNYSSGYNFAPGITGDDYKRVAFVSIQNGHTIAMEGMELPYVRTGYEYIIPHRVGKLFSHMAKEKGIVLSQNKYGIIVEYETGEKEGVELGIRYGRAEGTLYPSEIVTNLKKGDTFNAGDAIAWNDRFFEYDLFDERLAYKHTKMFRLVMLEGEQTFEDACSMSSDFIKQISSPIGKLRSITVNFSDEIIGLLPPGSKVSPMDPLLVIQDAVTSGMDVLEGDLKDSLLALSNNVPKADYTGTIDRVEVYYHGEMSDMSPSLKAITDASNKELASRHRSSGQTVLPGKVTGDYRVNGNSLELNTAEIRIYLLVNDMATNSDKIVVANQLKTTIGEVESPTYTESGLPIDCKFSRIAVDARIVGSFDEIAVLGTCLNLAQQELSELWKK